MTVSTRHRGSFDTEDSYEGIPIHASSGVHAKVARLLQSHLAPGSRVADLGAGHGALSLRLKNEGFSVDAFDFDATDWPLPAIPCTFIDLNQPLTQLKEKGPYDAICAIEVIEHLENPRQFIREIATLVGTKDCWLILSTPNPADTFSCISLFTRGIFNWFSEVHYTGGGHISILPHWMVIKHMETCGLRVEEVHFLSPYRHPQRLKQWVYSLLVAARRFLWRGRPEGAPEGQTALILAKVIAK
jgi:cyclopropane fatty-acyl-phospholipid synthase-like methyltransferase